jgi:hypothetical protein
MGLKKFFMGLIEYFNGLKTLTQGLGLKNFFQDPCHIEI